MMKIYIKYNPYKVHTEFKINDKPLKSERILKCVDKRLQYWLAPNNNNWNGIVEELAKVINETEFEIFFEGRKIDFEDLKLTVDKYKGKYDITLCHKDAKSDQHILEKMDKIISKFEAGPFEELKSEEVKKAYKEAKSSDFKINVIATMSAGKSTLINSLIGFELLPSKNEACTATVARIKDNDDMQNFIAVCRNKNEEEISHKIGVTLEDIEIFNEDKKVTYIDIEGSIPNISSDQMNLVIVDTPGPNNSRNKDHEQLTGTIIGDKDNSVVLYVMNITQFAINDDRELLTKISDAMKRGGKQSKDRFIFVINKCDVIDQEKEGSIEQFLKKVEDYLNQFGIEEPNLFPVSAEMAKLIRMYKGNKELTKHQVKFFRNYNDFIDDKCNYFDNLASLSESSRLSLNKKLKKADDSGDDYEEALIHTGVPAIEEAINEYLEKYAYPIKVDNAVERFLGIIEEKKMLTDLDNALSRDKEKFKDARDKIVILEKKLKEGKEIKKIKDKIDGFIINNIQFDNIGKETHKNLSKLTSPYHNKTSIEEEFARSEIERFKHQMSNLEKGYRLSLERAIKSSVIDEGEKLVEEYQSYLNSLKDDLKIEGFTFNKINDIRKINIEDVDDLMKKYTYTEEVCKDVEYKNETKKWYKPWTWGEDKYYTVREKIGEKNVINVSKLIQEHMGKIKLEIDKNIKSADEESKQQVKELKEYFKKELDKLDAVVKKTLRDIDKNTKKQELIQERVNINEKNRIWLNETITEINNIMKI
ncbi:dynamin family protein [Clostridium tarantellae]|uniref:Dynamin N-terminal domain-containing protein n=1 Tax=Clostridium tarantellae TaxID=39493 RepID=A0A6I1MMT0_9CLOT|nr:dynamin family protein [Clostridium tarantellae]MPQ43552.1 hypothetical protein [Clostridium tarantellae]